MEQHTIFSNVLSNYLPSFWKMELAAAANFLRKQIVQFNWWLHCMRRFLFHLVVQCIIDKKIWIYLKSALSIQSYCYFNFAIYQIVWSLNVDVVKMTAQREMKYSNALLSVNTWSKMAHKYKYIYAVGVYSIPNMTRGNAHTRTHSSLICHKYF